MIESWLKSIMFVLSWEGGLTDDPNDPGGLTKYGISQRSHPDLAVRNLTIEQATDIYKKDYWDFCNCNAYPYPLDICIFDTAVHMGNSKAMNLIDQIRDNGIVYDDSWKDYLILRIAKYGAIAKKNPQYLRGWINRVFALYQICKRK